MYPRPGSNRHGFKGQGILSPSCLPIPPLRHLHKKSRTDSGPCGAENETRTRDPDLGKVVLYQLSYFRFASRIGVFVTTRHNQTSFASALAVPKTPPWLLSGKRDSNSRPRPWQGRALPTELFPPAFSSRHSCSRLGIIKLRLLLRSLLQEFRLRIARQKYNFFQYCKQLMKKFFFLL